MIDIIENPVFVLIFLVVLFLIIVTLVWKFMISFLKTKHNFNIGYARVVIRFLVLIIVALIIVIGFLMYPKLIGVQ